VRLSDFVFYAALAQCALWLLSLAASWLAERCPHCERPLPPFSLSHKYIRRFFGWVGVQCSDCLHEQFKRDDVKLEGRIERWKRGAK